MRFGIIGTEFANRQLTSTHNILIIRYLEQPNADSPYTTHEG